MSGLTAFVELRDEVRLEPIGDGGPDACTALTAALDRALRELAESVIDEPFAVVALGGYGRSEQCLWSDVDVTLLHDGADVDRITKATLYPLWDANLKVGHSVRTVADSVAAAKETFETLTSLLSARHIAGNADLTDQLLDAIAKLLKGRPLAHRLADQERHRRDADPYQVMAADLKEGRGGLRTFQGFWWERRRAALLDLPFTAPTAQEHAAYATLLTARNALHAAAGRSFDRFVPDLRNPAAAWLGMDPFDLASTVTHALQLGDRLAERRWPDLHPGGDPMVGLGRRVFAAVRHRFGSRPDPGPPSPPLAVALDAAARPEGVWLTEAERDVITSETTGWGEGDREALVKLLSAGQRGRAAFALLEDLGWVEAAFPEWLPVSALPQLAPFHEHPVDAHLWRTVAEAAALRDDADPLVVELMEELDSDEELLLAAFLHDIGKGHGGNHEERGAVIARDFLRRTGFGPATTAVVVTAVRHHLLLSRTARRRDVTDPQVVAEIADIVGDRRTLRLLYLLTVADARATGPGMWTEWKATPVRSLFLRAAALLGDAPVPTRSDKVEEAARLAADLMTTQAIEEHVAAMPSGYLDTVEASEIVWHADAAARVEATAIVSPSPTDPTMVVVAGSDRRGFLLAVARVFAVHGVGIDEARFATRADGIAVDTLRVRSDRRGDAVSRDRWEIIQHDLAEVLDERRDVRAALRERARAYRTQERIPAAVRHLPGVSRRSTAIEVKAGDRIGLLADIVEALYSEGLDVHFAVLDTRAGEAVDVFHVRRAGVPIRAEAELAAMCRRIADRINDA